MSTAQGNGDYGVSHEKKKRQRDLEKFTNKARPRHLVKKIENFQQLIKKVWDKGDLTWRISRLLVNHQSVNS